MEHHNGKTQLDGAKVPMVVKFADAKLDSVMGGGQKRAFDMAFGASSNKKMFTGGMNPGFGPYGMYGMGGGMGYNAMGMMGMVSGGRVVVACRERVAVVNAFQVQLRDGHILMMTVYTCMV